MRKLRTWLALLCLAPVLAFSTVPNSLALLSNAAVTGPALFWQGGVGVYTAMCTWSGATVTLQYLGPDNSTWIAAGSGTTLTANGNSVVYLPQGFVRALITGTPSACYATVSAVQN